MSKLAKALTAAAGNAGESLYVEDVFSTYLYTGTDSAQTITNGIDLDGEGGLVWTKQRDIDPYNHMLVDTEQGLGYWLESNTTDAAGSFQHISVNSDGYNILGGYGGFNQSPSNYASWTFRKAEKFFDVVTYTGDGVAGREIAHNLGSVPACIIVKRTDSAFPWVVYHTSIGNDKILQLDDTAATQPYDNWYSTDPTSSVFTINSYGSMNASGGTYVAYLFASDAGGFGDDGSESIIKCGSFTADGSGAASVNLGWEAQWILHKTSSTTGSWGITDNMRGMPATGSNTSQRLEPNSSLAEETRTTRYTNINSTGFNVDAPASSTSIYIAIRRPMKTPESGTEVFSAIARTGTGGEASISGLLFPPDAVITRNRPSNESSRFAFYDKLRGATKYLDTAATGAEFTVAESLKSFDQTGETFGTGVISNANGDAYINWQFKRATGFFDVVAYTGDGTTGSISHNLNATPEMYIIKRRDFSDGQGWMVYHKDAVASGAANAESSYLTLNSSDASVSNTNRFGNVAPTDTTFGVSSSSANESGSDYIAYLFASLAGVSKVGSYTGTGADLNVDCGFSAGARFVLIKRTDSTGDWYVWDSVRGIVAGNDPYLLLNSTAAEVTNTDYIDPLASGFTVTSSAPAALNASGGTYIFLAIA